MADVGIRLTAKDDTRAAFDSVGRSLSNVQSSAASVAGALAGIGVGISVGGFVAMTKSIVDGLDALNDLRDATGASIENISALEDVARRTGAGFDVVSTSLIKLNQGLNAAKPGSDTENAIKAIGLSVKDLKALDPAEAFRKVAVGLSGFADDANKARLVQELFGKSLKEVAPFLNDLAASGQLNATVTAKQAEEAEKFNKQLANLQKNITDVGRAFVGDLLPGLNAGIERFILARKYAGGLLETLALYGRLDYGKSIQGNLGDVEEQLAQLEERATRITSPGAMAGNDKMIADLKAQANYLKELRQAKILAEQGDNGDAVSRRFTRDRPSLNVPDQSIKKDAAAAAAKALAEQNRELAAQNKLIAENAGLTGSFSEDWARLTAIYTKGGFSLEQYTEAQAKLLANQPAIKSNLEAEAKANALAEKASAEALESRQKYLASLGEGLERLQQETLEQQEYIDRLGLSKEAVAALDAAKLESQATIQDLIVLKKIEQGLDKDQYEIYVKTAAELRKQAALKMQGSIKETQLETEKEITAERLRGWQETDRIARDVFSNWATDGSNAAQKIGDTLKKALLSAIYEATLQPIVAEIYNYVGGTGGGGGTLGGVGGVGGGRAGGVGGLYNMGQQAYGLYDKGTRAYNWLFGGGGSAAPSGATGVLASQSPNSLAAAGGGSYANPGLGATTTTGASGAPASSGIGAAGMATVVFAVIALLASRDATRVRSTGESSTIYDAAGNATTRTNNRFSDGGGYTAVLTDGRTQADVDAENEATAARRTADLSEFDTKANAYVDSLNAAYQEAAKSLGFGTVGTSFSFGSNDSNGGKFRLGSSTGTRTFDSGEIALNDGELKLAASRAIFTALAGSELPKYLQGVFDGVDAAKLDQEGIDAAIGKAVDLKDAYKTLQQIPGTNLADISYETLNSVAAVADELATVNIAFYNFGYTLLDVSAAGGQAAANLVAAFGGLQAAQAQFSSYFQNFYSQAEQQATTYAMVQADLQKVGITYTVEQLQAATRGDIRAAVDSLAGGASTTEGAAQYAAAVKAANLLSTVKPALDTIASQSSEPVGGGVSAPVQDSALAAWEEATQAIVDAMRDLRVTLLDSGPDSFAKLQAQFVIETASAKAGNLAARQELPQLARTLADMSKGQFTSGVQRDLFIARLIESLGDVVGAGSAGANLSIPRFAAGGYHSGGWAIVGEQGPELVNMPSARVFNAGDTRAMLGGGGSDPAMLKKLEDIERELQGIRASSGSTAASSEKAAKVLSTAANNGQPLGVKVIS